MRSVTLKFRKLSDENKKALEKYVFKNTTKEDIKARVENNNQLSLPKFDKFKIGDIITFTVEEFEAIIKKNYNNLILNSTIIRNDSGDYVEIHFEFCFWHDYLIKNIEITLKSYNTINTILPSIMHNILNYNTYKDVNLEQFGYNNVLTFSVSKIVYERKIIGFN